MLQPHSPKPPSSISLSKNHPLSNCTSVTDLTRLPKLEQEEGFGSIKQHVGKNPRNSESEFLFFLKLKMVRLMGMLNGGSEGTQMLRNDPNEILGALAKQVGEFEKKHRKELTELEHKNKELEIRVIDLETSLQTQQTQSGIHKNKLQKLTKSHNSQMNKNQKSMLEKEAELHRLQVKIQELTQVYEIASRASSEAKAKIESLSKQLKQSARKMMEQEKDWRRRVAEEHNARNMVRSQLEQMKDQVLKMSHERSRDRDNIARLSKQVNKKSQQIEQAIKRNDCLLTELEKELQLSRDKDQLILTLKTENGNLQKITEKIANFQNRLNDMGSKFTQLESRAKDAESKCQVSIPKVKGFMSDLVMVIEKYKLKQEEIQKRMSEIDKSHNRQLRLIEEEHQVQLRMYEMKLAQKSKDPEEQVSF